MDTCKGKCVPYGKCPNSDSLLPKFRMLGPFEGTDFFQTGQHPGVVLPCTYLSVESDSCHEIFLVGVGVQSSGSPCC